MALQKWKQIKTGEKSFENMETNDYRCEAILESLAWLQVALGKMDSFPGKTDLEDCVRDARSCTQLTWERINRIGVRWEATRILQEKQEVRNEQGTD